MTEDQDKIQSEKKILKLMGYDETKIDKVMNEQVHLTLQEKIMWLKNEGGETNTNNPQNSVPHDIYAKPDPYNYINNQQPQNQQYPYNQQQPQNQQYPYNQQQPQNMVQNPINNNNNTIQQPINYNNNVNINQNIEDKQKFNIITSKDTEDEKRKMLEENQKILRKKQQEDIINKRREELYLENMRKKIAAARQKNLEEDIIPINNDNIIRSNTINDDEIAADLKKINKNNYFLKFKHLHKGKSYQYKFNKNITVKDMVDQLNKDGIYGNFIRCDSREKLNVKDTKSLEEAGFNKCKIFFIE